MPPPSADRLMLRKRGVLQDVSTPCVGGDSGATQLVHMPKIEVYWKHLETLSSRDTVWRQPSLGHP